MIRIQILADQLTLFQPGWEDYAHYITTGIPGFSDLPMTLVLCFFLNTDVSNHGDVPDQKNQKTTTYFLRVNLIQVVI